MSEKRSSDKCESAWIAQNLEMLNEPHIAPLIEYVRILRERHPQKCIPYFDPRDGGVLARVLRLKEAPGPTAIESGFVAPENKGQTAKNLRELREC